MNTDANCVQIYDLHQKIEKLKIQHRTNASRFQHSKRRLTEANQLYKEVNPNFTTQEHRIQQRVSAKLRSAPGFAVTFASTLVSLFQTRVQQHQEAQIRVQEEEIEFQDAEDILHSASHVLTAFAKKMFPCHTL